MRERESLRVCMRWNRMEIESVYERERERDWRSAEY